MHRKRAPETGGVCVAAARWTFSCCFAARLPRGRQARRLNSTACVSSALTRGLATARLSFDLFSTDRDDFAARCRFREKQGIIRE